MCDVNHDSYHPITIGLANVRGHVPEASDSPWMYNFLVKLLQRDHQVAQLDGGRIRGRRLFQMPKYIPLTCTAIIFHKPEIERCSVLGPGVLATVYPRQGIARLESLKLQSIPHCSSSYCTGGR
jgi:hypothetical protein